MPEIEHFPFENLPLPYGYAALEPYIDERTLRLHHDKHLQGYIENLNIALKERPPFQNLTLEQLIYTSARMNDITGLAILRNAGGVYNHRFYFNCLCPTTMLKPCAELITAFDRDFGSFEHFRDSFIATSLSVFGSGYCWLVCDSRGRLNIITTANQDTPLLWGMCPILTVDVWEHSYYLKHFNKRSDHLNDCFKILNWKWINERYLACTFRPK